MKKGTEKRLPHIGIIIIMLEYGDWNPEYLLCLDRIPIRKLESEEAWGIIQEHSMKKRHTVSQGKDGIYHKKTFFY